jgi:hypothetical protein
MSGSKMHQNNFAAVVGTEAGEPDAVDGAHGMWYKWTTPTFEAPPVDVTFLLDTTNAAGDFDSLMFVYRLSGGTGVADLVLDGYNDDCDGTGELGSCVTVAVNSGDVVFFRVSGLDSELGEFDILWSIGGCALATGGRFT